MHRRTIVPLLLLMTCIALAAGCAKDNTARWAQARDTLTTTQDNLREAHDSGKLSDKDLLALDPYVQSIRKALDRADELLPSGGTAFDFYMKLVEDSLVNFKPPNLKKLTAAKGAADGTH